MPILRVGALLSLLLGLMTIVTVPGGALAAASRAPGPLALQIKTEGIYRLTYSYLARHHFNPAMVDVRKLGLSDSGIEIPIYLHHANGASHAFGRQDYIDFYAHPVFNTYTSTNTYVLTDAGGNTKRVRLEAAATARSAVTVAQNTYVDQHRTFFEPLQEDVPAATVSTAWPSTGDSHWKETQLIVATQRPSASDAVNFSLANPVPDGTCTITVPTLGYADQFSDSPAFQMSLQVGGANVVNAYDGTTSFTWRASSSSADTTANGSFPCTALGSATGRPASESVTISSSIQSGVLLGEVLPQYFAITYPEHLCAIGNQLSWEGSGPSGYTVSGFDSSSISVWRVAENTITRFAGISAGSASGGNCGSSSGYTTSFADTSQGQATYVASAKPLTPASAGPLDERSITSGRSGSVRYLIITAPQFTSTVQPLARYHDQHGLPTKVVTTQAIYDQYRSRLGRFVPSGAGTAGPGDGQLNPEAIRAYISFAVRHLGVKYVLIAGGDTQDPHNFYGCPQSGLCADANPRNVGIVPTLYENSVFDGPTASDNLYVVPLGQSTTAPDAAIGRLPAVTTSGLQTEVARSIGWASWVRSYEKTATFVSGFGSAGDYGGSCADPQFPSASDGMASHLPASWTISKAYEDGTQADDVANRSRFLTLFDRGQEIVNYVGHGNLQQWSCLPELTSADIRSLTNTNRLAAVFQWGCQATDFVNPQLPNIDSLLLQARNAGRPTGAAVAVGSTGTDLAYPQALLAGGVQQPGGDPYFYGYLARGDSVGQALQYAKDDMVTRYAGQPVYANYADVVNSYTVLGDPALMLPT